MPPLPDVTQMTRDLVQIPSESSDPVATLAASPERHVLEYLESVCRVADLDHFTMEALPGRHNLVVRLPNPGAPRILIVAHMDTVSGRGMDNPFLAVEHDGMISGRGTCDDKGPLAAGLSAILSIHQQKITPAFDITFAASVDEECSMAGAERLAEQLPGWDLCLAMEPTKLQIIRAHKGVYRCRVTTSGRAAHSSHPEKGINAINAMLPVINDLLALGTDLSRPEHPDLGRATLAVTRIMGGSSPNTIPDRCEVTVDIRLLPDMTPQFIARKIKDYVGNRGAIDEIYLGDGIATDMDNPLIQRLKETIHNAGADPGPITAAYATDCSRLHHRGPCLVWGPGNIDLAHQADEHIPVAELIKGEAILRAFLTNEAHHE
ncbi:MAG: M20 family metallopeptidase [Proteobacteria bacterium]|nr:M20 family metallopeptidase [Pseudomonadota bacterium]MBU1688565.1 M20 family metallopeptidase [Pseudomonadota bacterium]